MIKLVHSFFRRFLARSAAPALAAAVPPEVPVSEALPPLAAHAVLYDENLLERSRLQWQFGDWDSLARIDRDTLQHHPDRAKLALLVAAGLLQTDQQSAARQMIRLARDWGCNPRQLSQILIAGVHNSLGRAATAAGQQARGLRHFDAAIRVGTPGADAALLARARAQQQAGLQRLAAPETAGWPQQLAAAPAPTQLAAHALGHAWAGNTINTVIFRHHGILTWGRQQYTAFYVDRHTLRLVQRDLDSDAIRTHDLAGEYNLRDAHNSISLGMDRHGHLHLSYDHHATQLRYRRATRPDDIGAWSDEQSMTGMHEQQITYPTFILPRHGYPLTLLYRDGKHNKGIARLKTYDEQTESWTDHALPVLSGAEQQPWTSNAYWNHPALGSDGSLHLTFVWRTHALGEEERLNNINIGYACSMDNGRSWFTSQGQPYRLPITQVNAETIHPVSPGTNLINQTSMALDSHNRPHLVFYANDEYGIPQYQHLRFDGKRWRHQCISARSAAFELHGGGTLRLPISRPEIVIDDDDHAYVIYRGDLSDDRLTALCLRAPDYRYDPAATRCLWEEPLGFAEPVIDRMRWQRDRVLSVLLQHNEQPDNDVGHAEINHPMTLLDLRFT